MATRGRPKKIELEKRTVHSVAFSPQAEIVYRQMDKQMKAIGRHQWFSEYIDRLFLKKVDREPYIEAIKFELRNTIVERQKNEKKERELNELLKELLDGNETDKKNIG